MTSILLSIYHMIMTNIVLLTTDERQEADQLIDELSGLIDDISKFSVYHDDMFNVQTGRLEDLVKELRQQLK